MTDPNGSVIPNEAFVPVWSPGVSGKLLAKWYPNSLCDHSSMMWETEYIAFDTPMSSTSRTCKEASAQLRLHLSPVHTTPWNCVFSEPNKMWFREECHVRTIAEKIVDDDFWKTPGGVILALFIAFVCVFCLWWLSLCYRNRAVVGICDGMQQIDLDHRLAGTRRYGGRRQAPFKENDDDDDLIFSKSNNPEVGHAQHRDDSETRVRVGVSGGTRNIYEN